MTVTHVRSERYLAFRSGSMTLVLPLESTVMVTRRLPLQPVSGIGSGVLGITTIRGRQCAVLDLCVFLGSNSEEELRRLVVVPGRNGWVALGVAEVIGILRLPGERIEALPPLFAELETRGIVAFACHDDGLYQVLDAARLLPPDFDVAMLTKGDDGSGD